MSDLCLVIQLQVGAVVGGEDLLRRLLHRASIEDLERTIVEREHVELAQALDGARELHERLVAARRDHVLVLVHDDDAHVRRRQRRHDGCLLVQHQLRLLQVQLAQGARPRHERAQLVTQPAQVVVLYR